MAKNNDIKVVSVIDSLKFIESFTDLPTISTRPLVDSVDWHDLLKRSNKKQKPYYVALKNEIVLKGINYRWQQKYFTVLFNDGTVVSFGAEEWWKLTTIIWNSEEGLERVDSQYSYLDFYCRSGSKNTTSPRTEGIIQKEHSKIVKSLAKPGYEIIKDLTSQGAHLWHMSSCLQSEAGELFDAIKQVAIYGKSIEELDMGNVIEELGDCEFYIEGIRQSLGITREMTLINNQKKLLKRYDKGKYSNSQAKERKDKND